MMEFAKLSILEANNKKNNKKVNFLLKCDAKV